jgi:hypothetical protein
MENCFRITEFALMQKERNKLGLPQSHSGLREGALKDNAFFLFLHIKLGPVSSLRKR